MLCVEVSRQIVIFVMYNIVIDYVINDIHIQRLSMIIAIARYAHCAIVRVLRIVCVSHCALRIVCVSHCALRIVCVTHTHCAIVQIVRV